MAVICWFDQAWKDVKPETIQKCFVRSGFRFLERFDDANLPNSPERQEPLVPDIANIMDTEPSTTNEYLNIEHGHQLHILDGDKWKGNVCPVCKDSNDTHDDTIPDDRANELPTPWNQDRISALHLLKLYANSKAGGFELVVNWNVGQWTCYRIHVHVYLWTVRVFPKYLDIHGYFLLNIILSCYVFYLHVYYDCYVTYFIINVNKMIICYYNSFLYIGHFDITRYMKHPSIANSFPQSQKCSLYRVFTVHCIVFTRYYQTVW